ncbi:hypothetical protein QQX98_000038 [Neonectria punicea]|uniref:DUF7580 domain-containing protein n=1 Tax=Neonectria punicea TaxID=979145 RepID=A0ABR1HVB5_9HYPO
MSFNKSRRESLFQQLTKGTDQLRDLLDSSDRIASLQQNRGAAKPANTNAMRQFWRHTDKLYKLLTRSWNCECKQFHLANLLLQHRASPDLDFRISFFFGNSNEVTKPSWTHLEARLRILEHNQQDSIKTRGPAVTFAPDPVPISSAAKARSNEELRSLTGSFMGRLKKEKKPSCATPVSDALLVSLRSTTAAATKTVDPPQLIVTNPDGNVDPSKLQGIGEGMIEINNLCDEMPKFPAKANGQLFCLKDDHCRIAINPLCHSTATTSTAARDMISLDALLRKNTPRTLTRRERYLIGLTLASSYLQLKSSPWIHHQWSKRDIVFPRNEVSPNCIQVDQPYISRHFKDADNAQTVPTVRLDHNDRTLVSLGIMLLELCFGTALEESETRRRYYHQTSPGEANEAKADPYLDLAAALEWFPHAV